jgi:hypothetical protein
VKTKTCTKCGKEKPATLEFFHRANVHKDGLQYECKECRRKYAKKWFKTNAKKQRILQRKRNYGLTENEYNAMVFGQENKCAICKKQKTTEQNLDVDHDHRTGKVRGLLCRRCNLVLGMTKEDKLLLYAIINYLDRHNEDE